MANEIESTYPVKTKWIAADFRNGNEIYEHIKNELEGIQVGILGKYFLLNLIFIILFIEANFLYDIEIFYLTNCYLLLLL